VEDQAVGLFVLELVCSRLCHDLVGPVGAAANGIELLRETGGGLNADILDMTDESTRIAWRRLEFFRVAFGHGGGRPGWSESELAALARGMLHGTRASLAWPHAAIGPTIGGRGGKLILNLIFLITEAMPRGGEVRVSVADAGSDLKVEIAGLGAGAILNPRVFSTVTGQEPPGELDSRVILAHLAYLQTLAAGAALAWHSDDRTVRVSIRLPQPATVAA
jgi:histidine phosphotransferase ChpT